MLPRKVLAVAVSLGLAASTAGTLAAQTKGQAAAPARGAATPLPPTAVQPAMPAIGAAALSPVFSVESPAQQLRFDAHAPSLGPAAGSVARSLVRLSDAPEPASLPATASLGRVYEALDLAPADRGGSKTAEALDRFYRGARPPPDGGYDAVDARVLRSWERG